jgi:aldehyde:ferredoxin oxidoreductase
VVFGVGPITDTTVPGNSRACVATKSPLTGLFFDSTFGGRFPATLKRTGFDAVAITGCASAPSYLVVTETGATVKPAQALWGKSTRDAVNALIDAEGADADAIAIGPAASIACASRRWRTTGRTARASRAAAASAPSWAARISRR